MHPLEVTQIRKRFGSFQAVKELTFSVQPGEVLGIVGPNGAGKTTTIKMILGLLEPDSGEIKLFGKPISSPEVRAKIGYMPETPTFYNNLTGREILGFVADLFQLPRDIATTRKLELLKKVGLQDAADRQLKYYSKGMLQRICLAQALVNNPELLFLDEPLDGLDPLGRIAMKETLLEVKQTGCAIVFNSHILSDVEAVSDRIAIMDHGSLLKLEPVKTLVPKGKSLEDVFISTVMAHA